MRDFIRTCTAIAADGFLLPAKKGVGAVPDKKHTLAESSTAMIFPVIGFLAVKTPDAKTLSYFN